MKKLNRSCPVCGSRQGTVITTVDAALPNDLSIPGKYDVVACTECGFTYADVNASQDAYNKYYRTSNVYSADAEIKAESNCRYNELRCQLLKQYVDREKQILDVGCGSGKLLAYLKSMGYDSLCGLDPSKESIQKLEEQKLLGKTGNIFDEVPDTWQHSFDVVMSTSVIEHIYDINLFIVQLKKYVKPGGMIFIEAPAVEGFEKYDTPFSNYFNHEHINYFSLVSLDNLFAKHGYIRVNSEQESYVQWGVSMIELGLLAIYKNAGESALESVFQKDETAQASIQNYLQQAEEKSCAVDKRLLDFLTDNPSGVVIWGMGSYTMQLLQRMPQLMEQVKYFIDNNETKVGKKIMDKEVFSPQKLAEDEVPYPILICSMASAKDIVKQISQMGIRNQYLCI